MLFYQRLSADLTFTAPLSNRRILSRSDQYVLHLHSFMCLRFFVVCLAFLNDRYFRVRFLLVTKQTLSSPSSAFGRKLAVGSPFGSPGSILCIDALAAAPPPPPPGARLNPSGAPPTPPAGHVRPARRQTRRDVTGALR